MPALPVRIRIYNEDHALLWDNEADQSQPVPEDVPDTICVIVEADTPAGVLKWSGKVRTPSARGDENGKLPCTCPPDRVGEHCFYHGSSWVRIADGISGGCVF